MECEKFEPLLLDELYEELDEVTSAAVKRHVAGCARCAGILNGMRATRSAAVLPIEQPSEGFEERILAATKEAQKVVPIQSRMSSALSWAGRWAMRPQTAMAAVFLLMIGSSAFVIRARKESPRAASVSVTVEGAPEPQQVAAAETSALDNPAAATAHGPTVPPVRLAPPSASASSATIAANEESAGPMDKITGKAARLAKDKEEDGLASALAAAPASPPAAEALADSKKTTTAPARSRAALDPSNAGAPGGAYAAADDLGANSPTAQAPMPAATTAKRGDAQDGFSAGTAAYRARNYGEATRQFDGAAQGGDSNAALWAARSVRDGNGGCAPALARFDAIAQKAGSTWTGNQAQLEAARCQVVLGQWDAARDRLNRLTQVPSHAQEATQALAELNQIASRREADRAKSGGGSAAGRAAPAPARASAKPATKGSSDPAY